MDRITQSFEALFAHERFVRTLARSLVQDDAAAEDLTQEAWLAALDRPAAAVAAPRGWLATVVHRLALNRRRAAQRAARRDAVAARPEAVPARAAFLEGEELRRKVVRAVLDLEEPFSTVVLLRFFEDLAPREIAARLDAPLETVKSRLKRGLARLRERLDADAALGRAQWTAALLPLAGAAPGVVGAHPIPTTVLQGLLVGTKAKVVMAGALMLVASALIWPTALGWPAPRPPIEGGVGDASVPARASAGDPASRHAGRDAHSQSAVAAAAGRTDGATIQPVPFREAAAPPDTGGLIINALWNDDHTPARNVSIFVDGQQADRSSRDRYAEVSDAEGIVRMPAIRPGQYGIYSDRGAEGESGAAATVVAGRVTEVEMAIPVTTDVLGIVVDAHGEGIGGAEVFVLGWLGPLPHAPTTVTRGDGTFTIRSAGAGAGFLVARSLGRAVSEYVPIRAPGSREATRLVLGAEGEVVTGTVTDPGGHPVVGAEVRVGPEGLRPVIGPDGKPGIGLPALTARTTDDGGFRVIGVPLGEQLLLASARGFGPWAGHVIVTAKTTAPVRARLPRGATLHGIVRNPDGRPAPDATVTIAAGDLMNTGIVRADAEGRFVFDGLPPCRASVTAQGRQREVGTAEVDTAEGAEVTTEIRLVEGSTLHGRIVDELDRPLARWPVELVQIVAENGVEFRSTFGTAMSDAQGRFELRNCRPSIHELSTAAPDSETVTGAASLRLDRLPGEEVTLRVRTRPR